MTENFCRCPECGECSGSRQRRETVAWLKGQIAEIEADPRFSAPPATVFANAPLALVQVGLKSKHDTLTQALKKLGAG